MNTALPLTKSQTIELSLRCFARGLISFLPLVGWPFVVMALMDFARVKRRGRAGWNPAQRYLRWGGLCGVLGLLLEIITFAIIYAAILRLLGYEAANAGDS